MRENRAEPDIVDLMIKAYREQSLEGLERHELARHIWNQYRPRLTDIDIGALEATGQEAVENEGVPEQYPPEADDNLAFLGFMAILAENLMADNA